MYIVTTIAVAVAGGIVAFVMQFRQTRKRYKEQQKLLSEFGAKIAQRQKEEERLIEHLTKIAQEEQMKVGETECAQAQDASLKEQGHVAKDDKTQWGQIPWGPWNPRNGYDFYYEGDLLNGQPHGFGTIYRCTMNQCGHDEVVESGRWEYGYRCYDVNHVSAKELTAEELRDIMHDRL